MKDDRFKVNMINLTNFYWAKNVSSYFEGLYKDKDDCDMYLCGDDKVLISAHKIVLKVGSSFFRDILSNTNSFVTVPVFYIRGADKTSLLKILEFLYIGQARVDQNKLEDFMKISADLSIFGLSQSANKKDGLKEKDDSDSDQIYSNLVSEESEHYMNMTGASKYEDDDDRDDHHLYASLDDNDTKPENVDQHPKSLNEDDNLNCPLCDKTFKSKQSLKMHRYRLHTKEKLLQQSLIALT